MNIRIMFIGKPRFWIFNVLTKYSGIKDSADNDKLLTFEEVVNIMNEQDKEIKELKNLIKNI